MAAQRSKASEGEQPAAALLRKLPAVERVLADPGVAGWIQESGQRRDFAAQAAARFVEGLRAAVLDGRLDGAGLETRLNDLATGVARAADELVAPHLGAAINATGVVVHTNLGRSPWPAAAAERVAELSQRYLNLELDLESGGRGQRAEALERLIDVLLPGAGVAVVNNNAAAVLLVLNTFAEGREVVVSRGQLVEIGGSFRIPDVCRKSGATLREVGTTNRTRLADYEAVLGERTGAMLSVHPSNYRIVGFTEEAGLDELARLGAAHDVPVIEDLGSGCFFDLREVGIADEPTVAERLATGVDLVTFSGDKLLGGPQAGFVVGKTEHVARVRSNPMYRALRLDKSKTLALEATLAIYVRGDLDEIPTLRMLRTPLDELESRARDLATRLADEHGVDIEGAAIDVVEVSSRVGGGAAPESGLPSFAVSIAPPDTAEAFTARLRGGDPPVVARIADERVLLDVRTILPDEEDALVAAVSGTLAARADRPD